MPEQAIEEAAARPEAGFAHVAALAFVAARAVPGFAFPISLVGGTGVAHATDKLGGRRGLAAGIAAAIESIAILGPARMSGPGGQLITAPLIGLLHRRGRGRLAQLAACALVRALFNVVTTVLFIGIIAGGVDNYAGTYDATLGRIPGAPEGTAAALVATLIGIGIWSVGASLVQILIFSRADRRWGTDGGIGTEGEDDEADTGDPPPAADDPDLPAEHSRGRRFDPRAVIAAAVVAFALLLLSTSPPLLAAVALWLLIAWQLAPAEAAVLKPGLVLALTLATGAFVVNWVGGDSISAGVEHGARGALLVMTATWMRGAAGSDGVREVARRMLARADRVRSTAELRVTLDSLSGDRRMGAAIRSLTADVRAVEGDLERMLNAAIDWAAAEARRFRPGPPEVGPALAYGPLDLLVLIGAALPALTLAPG